MMVIDADGAVLGRMASQAAKALLRGERVAVVNAEKALISGRREDIYAKYKMRVDRANRANPHYKGPHFPRTPDLLVKRAIRGMVGLKTGRGAKAYKSLRVYVGVPDELKGKGVKREEQMPRNVMSVLELSKMLGWKARV